MYTQRADASLGLTTKSESVVVEPLVLQTLQGEVSLNSFLKKKVARVTFLAAATV